MTAPTVPVALFAYARPDHLQATLASLQNNHVPLIYAFSDSPRTTDKHAAVAEVRAILRGIDWCEVILKEHDTNLGVGRSILSGVTSVLARHDMALIFEDDLICVSGAYRYLSEALYHYRDDPAVMSVTGWTHPRITPGDVERNPYFDGRAECLVWGTWARAWHGMDRPAVRLMRTCAAQGLDIYRYGADLPRMALEEQQRNIWAVRWLYLHILQGGLCLRPPHSMVEHIGFDLQATNAPDGTVWANPALRPSPPLPVVWPAPREHEACAHLWQAVLGSRPGTARPRTAKERIVHTRAILRESIKSRVPPTLLRSIRVLRETANTPGGELGWQYVPEGWSHHKPPDQDAQGLLDSYTAHWPAFVETLRHGLLTENLGEPERKDRHAVYVHNAVMSYAYVLGLASHLYSRLSILDWNGGIGQHYLIGNALYPDLEIEFHCKTEPLLAEYGRTLLPEVHFHLDAHCLTRPYDLVIVNTERQGEEHWQANFSALAQATHGYLFAPNVSSIRRTPSYVMALRLDRHRVDTTSLRWCLNRTEFVDWADESGLSLVREFVSGPSLTVFRAPEQPVSQSYLFSRDTTAKAITDPLSGPSRVS
jgi:hypothetical protein